MEISQIYYLTAFFGQESHKAEIKVFARAAATFKVWGPLPKSFRLLEEFTLCVPRTIILFFLLYV